MPVFSKYVSFKNEYSKKMFIFDNKYILLKIEKENENDIILIVLKIQIPI